MGTGHGWAILQKIGPGGRRGHDETARPAVHWGDVSTEQRPPAKHLAPARRRKILAEPLGTARHVLADLEPGCELVCLTHGQFSIIHALEALLDYAAPARVTISTWSAAHADLEHAERLLVDGRIESIRFLVDRSFATRQPAYCATLRRLYGDDAIRTTRVHAKFATVRGGAWDFAVRTSMNLNENPRLELLEVSDDPTLADFLDGQVDDLFATVAAGDFAAGLVRVAPSVAPSAVEMGRRVRMGA